MLATQLSIQVRDFIYGGNPTAVSFKDTLRDVTWQMATTRLQTKNTIAALAYHIHYYIKAQLNVLENGILDAHDKYSFDVPAIASQAEWNALTESIWKDADRYIKGVALLTDVQLWSTFVEEKYGTYYRNIQGLLEHSYYHLGQIVLLKKLVIGSTSNSGT